jgi:hypothetical protein
MFSFTGREKQRIADQQKGDLAKGSYSIEGASQKE